MRRDETGHYVQDDGWREYHHVDGPRSCWASSAKLEGCGSEAERQCSACTFHFCAEHGCAAGWNDFVCNECFEMYVKGACA